ncbi:MAG: alpha/beta hydrolase [Alistipes sp.]|jgi:pimeloyl-ACP methyl ester carboxylesterase|nr:alpha/beta hydrolase [Alistipes sp.]
MNSPTEIVLLHGWGCDGSIWAGVKAHLTEAGHRVEALDFPGFGTSQEPPEAWGMEDYAAWFERWLTERGIVNPVLVGHSFGGRVAIIHASRNAVGKVVLVDAAGVKPRRGMTYYIKVWSFKAMKRLTPIVLGRARAQEMINRRRAAAGSADYRAASPVMRGTLSRVVNEDLRRHMPLIAAPTLLVWGSADTATPVSDARKMERLIPDAGLVVFEGAGHFSFLERPAQFAAVLDSFLKS